MLATLATIAVLHWAVLLIPGFNFVLIGQLAAGGARPKALAAVGGMTLATLSWALLAVLGVGVVFTAQPALRQLAQLAGGLYLLQLAWKLWVSRKQPVAANERALSHAGAFRAGFFTSMLNPKIALFYGSVFATAMPAQPSLAMSAGAVALVFVNSVVWHSSLAYALSQPTVQRAYLRHFQRLNQLSAAIVGAFGARLLATTLQEWRARAS
ncbi:LysE family translocator [Roseateles violae]|uniref:LysE family transporter n=1 Tax=Roseateles violae TaxID=3058042 RepID=A0ABT8DNK8_9BURK|nr:LysE family transporter [Pelomonas sp. PFR6]MDN3919548.1 LysE family transporter [Pelomonas sp. PFR6]